MFRRRVKRFQSFVAVLVVVVLTTMMVSTQVAPAKALGWVEQSVPPCSGQVVYLPDGTVSCEYGDSDEEENGGNGSDGGPGGGSNAPGCIPGTTATITLSIPEFSTINVGGTNVTIPSLESFYWVDPPRCVLLPFRVDVCTGQILGLVSFSVTENNIATCTPNLPLLPPPSVNPCPGPSFIDGKISCSSWNVRAAVGPPSTTLAVRPYPVTLVEWPTSMRFNSIHSPTNSGFLAEAGAWRNFRLTLYFEPAASAINVFMENLGPLNLTLGQTVTFKYTVPSHPAVGGDDLAGVVGQLGELPADMPLFRNRVIFPFNLYCRVDLDYWNNYFWAHHSQTAKISPNNIPGLPNSWKLDLNGDGVADAFGGGTTILRMNDAGSTNDPSWRHSYSWGSIFFWAVREGQGQVGWP